MTQSRYMLNVKPIYWAVYPTIAGPNIKPEKPKVVRFETVREMGSEETIIACLITIAIKFAVNKPKITREGIIKYKLPVRILTNRIVAPKIDK